MDFAILMDESAWERVLKLWNFLSILQPFQEGFAGLR